MECAVVIGFGEILEMMLLRLYHKIEYSTFEEVEIGSPKRFRG